ncbi:MAG: SAM-dependent methyltransferase [Verrucomicrobia bacterium]|nr:SAM-dependent methyltransferase [Verrucomicrobiota bacterium]
MLYLLPNLLADLEDHTPFFSPAVQQAVASIDALIAEGEKEARRYLKRFTYPEPKTFRDIPLHLLNEHTTSQEKKALLQEIAKGGTWGLISDAGMPCIADPGADLVLAARERGIPVQAFSGPSSILLALILSGLGGQHFTFHGYLPKEEGELANALRQIEQRSRKEGSTHLFMETPYRNLKLFEKIRETLSPETWLSVATDLTAPTERVQTKRISTWRREAPPDLNKRPTVFVIKSLSTN